MQAIMYHYVRPGADGLPYFRYLHLSDFRRQLDALAADVGFVTREEFESALASEAPLPSGCLLTFDDGLRDHVEHVLPELERRGLWGIFYVPTGPYVTRSILDVHRVHLLLGRHGGSLLLQALQSKLSQCRVAEASLIGGGREEFHRLTYDTQDNDSDTSRFKRLLNYFLEDDVRARVLGELVEEYLDPCPTADDIYLSAGEIRRIQQCGSWVGSHSVTHRVLSRLKADEQAREISESFDLLEDLADGLIMRSFCYPYGGFHTFSETTEELLGEARSVFSFNVEPRHVTTEDLTARPQALPRYDCNQFAYGAATMG